MIYHITSRAAWNDAQQRDDYRAESLETEGFIHCSTASQVLPVVEKYYARACGLVLLMIDPTLLASDWKWEPPSGGTPPPGVPEGDLFPHIYGPINLSAILKVFNLEVDMNGNYNLPALE